MEQRGRWGRLATAPAHSQRCIRRGCCEQPASDRDAAYRGFVDDLRLLVAPVDAGVERSRRLSRTDELRSPYTPVMEPSPHPNASLRQKLLVAGIPESEHTLDALMSRMPDLDSPLLQGLSVDMMAELLLYLISKGVVTLPRASDKALLDLPWGSHVCQFYDSKQDQLDMLAAVLRRRGWNGTKRARGWSAT